MEIVIVYGNQRKGSTYNCVKLFKEALTEQASKHKMDSVNFTEYTMPNDLSNFCLGCFNCFLKGEEACPHRREVEPIEKSLRTADGIIISSPVYGLEVSGALKALFDHLCYIWMPHRPRKEMFSKVGMVISTTVGGGTGSCNKTMSRNLRYWGVNRAYKYGASVMAVSWNEVKDNKKKGIKKSLEKKARVFIKALKKRGKLRTSIFTRVFFILMRGLISSYDDGNKDKAYWKENGWLDKKKPF